MYVSICCGCLRKSGKASLRQCGELGKRIGCYSGLYHRIRIVNFGIS